MRASARSAPSVRRDVTRRRLARPLCAHEPAQRGVGRHRLELGPRFGQRDEVVVMELDAPALVRGVLREDGLAHRIADRNLLSGVGAQLAAEHADRIGALLQGPVVPALDGREAEPDRIAGGRMLPCAGGERRRSPPSARPWRVAPPTAGRSRRSADAPTARGPGCKPLDLVPVGSCRHSCDRTAPTVEAAATRWRRASCADEGTPLLSVHAASGDGTNEAQQRDETIGVIAGEAFEQRCRHTLVVDRRHERGASHPPERR